jgi:hypothetical protein
MEETHMPKKSWIELESHWKKILEDFAASGSGVSKYCQEHRISKASLYKWSKQLDIPLRNQCALTKTHQVDRSGVQASSTGAEESFSFIELKVPPSNASASLPIKLELLLMQERKLRIEMTSTWEQVVGMIKALVS